jgi:hypothetical protein
MAIDVLYIGNYRHPWCTEVHVARDLEALGHRVDRFQEPPGGGDHNTLEAIWRRGLTADLVLWTRTWGLPPEATNLWRRFEAHGIQTASYHLDLYLGLGRSANLPIDPFWTTAHVFTPDGNIESEATFTELGINHHWSPPAMVSDEIGYGTYQTHMAHDVIFVGSRQPPYHREWPHRGALLEHVQRRWDARIHPAPGTQVRNWSLNDLYASAKVVVGDTLTLPHNTCYLSDRYFETIGRGGFLIAPYVLILDHGLGFEDSKNIVTYEPFDWGDLDEKIDYYLHHDEERVEIQSAGMDLVQAMHTYQHRLQAALLTMGFTA